MKRANGPARERGAQDAQCSESDAVYLLSSLSSASSLRGPKRGIPPSSGRPAVGQRGQRGGQLVHIPANATRPETKQPKDVEQDADSSPSGFI